MGSCLYTLFHTHEQWSESQVSHVIWGSNPLNSPLLPPIPSVRSPTWALLQMIRHSALKRVALPSRSAESFPDFRLFWVDFVPWWCGVVLLGSRHALYSIKSGVVAPLGWGGARYLSQHTRHPPELSKGLFKPLNQGHAGQERTSTDKHTIILIY